MYSHPERLTSIPSVVLFDSVLCGLILTIILPSKSPAQRLANEYQIMPVHRINCRHQMYLYGGSISIFGCRQAIWFWVRAFAWIDLVLSMIFIPSETARSIFALKCHFPLLFRSFSHIYQSWDNSPLLWPGLFAVSIVKKSNTTGWLRIEYTVDIRFVHASDCRNITSEKNMVLRWFLYTISALKHDKTTHRNCVHFDWQNPCLLSITLPEREQYYLDMIWTFFSKKNNMFLKTLPHFVQAQNFLSARFWGNSKWKTSNSQDFLNGKILRYFRKY